MAVSIMITNIANFACGAIVNCRGCLGQSQAHCSALIVPIDCHGQQLQQQLQRLSDADVTLWPCLSGACQTVSDAGNRQTN